MIKINEIKKIVVEDRKKIWFATLLGVIVYSVLTGNHGVIVAMILAPIIYILIKYFMNKK